MTYTLVLFGKSYSSRIAYLLAAAMEAEREGVDFLPIGEWEPGEAEALWRIGFLDQRSADAHGPRYVITEAGQVACAKTGGPVQ